MVSLYVPSPIAPIAASLLPEEIIKDANPSDIIKGIDTFIKKEIEEDELENKCLNQRVSMYYFMLRTALKCIRNQKLKGHYLDFAAKIFPDQYLLYTSTALITDQVAFPFVKKVFFLTANLIEKAICLSGNQKAALKFRKKLITPLSRKEARRILSSLLFFVGDLSLKKPSSTPIKGPIEQVIISAAQHLTLIGIDGKSIFLDMERGIRNRLFSGRYTKYPIINQVCEAIDLKNMDLRTKEKELYKSTVQKVTEVAVRTLIYFFFYFKIAGWIAYSIDRAFWHSALFITKSEDAASQISGVVNSILLIGAWIPFLALTIWYTAPTASDFYRHYQKDWPHRILS